MKQPGERKGKREGIERVRPRGGGAPAIFYCGGGGKRRTSATAGSRDGDGFLPLRRESETTARKGTRGSTGNHGGEPRP